MTGSEIIAEKRMPDADKMIFNELIGEIRKMRYGKTRAFLFADTDTVYSVVTRSRGQRTEGGAGIGSQEERILDVVPDSRCRDEQGFHYCFVGRRKPGKVLTSFIFSRRTDLVARVHVGIVLD